MDSNSLKVALLISIFSISNLNAQNLIWDINASVINGFGIDLMITNYQKNSSIRSLSFVSASKIRVI